MTDPVDTVTFSVHQGLLSYVMGALEPLTYPYKWEKFGAVTPEESAQYFTEMMYGRGVNLSMGTVLPTNVVGEWRPPSSGFTVPGNVGYQIFSFDQSQSFVDTNYVQFNASGTVTFVKRGMYLFNVNLEPEQSQGTTDYVFWSAAIYKTSGYYARARSFWSPAGRGTINFVYSGFMGYTDALHLRASTSNSQGLFFAQSFNHMQILFLGELP